MRVLITGADGFLGRYAVARFSQRGADVTGVSRRGADRAIACQLGNHEETSALFHEQRPELCVHLAGPADVGASFLDPAADWQGQVAPLLSLLDAIRRHCPETRLLLVSSAAVYGETDSLPIPEDHPRRPISPYGWHKVCQERLLDEYRALFGLRVCKARVFSTYGEGQRRLLVWDFTRRALGGDQSVFGTGEETRDYLYAGDVAEALWQIANRAPFAGEAINVASGRETSVGDIARLICSELEIGAPFFTGGPGLQGLPTRWQANITRLTDMGFRPTQDLEQGIRRTVRWIRLTLDEASAPHA